MSTSAFLILVAIIGFELITDTSISYFVSVKQTTPARRAILNRFPRQFSKISRRWSAQPTPLNSQAAWSVNNSLNAEWVGPSVLAVNIGNMELSSRLGELCFSLEAKGCTRTMSNAGGFQSNNIGAHADVALSKLMSLLHEPLAAFLWRRWRGYPPAEVLGTEGLAITCRPEHIWANVNRFGHYNRLHEHGPPLLCRAASGIYYPFSGEEGTDKYSPPPAVVRLYDGGQLVEVKPSPGLLLLFPTSLLHEVDPSWPGSKPRASIAFNLFVRWLDNPLLRAACSGNVAQIQQLVAGGWNVDRADALLGFRAAHIAAEAGELSVLEALALEDADLTGLSREGWSPLDLAAAQGHLPVVQYLASSGEPALTRKAADAARDATELDLTRGFSGLDGALAVAAERGHQNIMNFLHGLSVDG